jgi:hypothetical protein
MRMCPKCGRLKNLDFNRSGGEFYLRWMPRKVERLDDDGEVEVVDAKVRVPSALCRECEKNRVKRARAAKKALSSLEELDPQAAALAKVRLRGSCDCCGRVDVDRVVIVEPRRGVVCRTCAGLIEQCGGDRDNANMQWDAIARHIGDELRLDEEWKARTDRRRRWHEGNADVGPGSPPHVHCIVMERLWHSVTEFLAGK